MIITLSCSTKFFSFFIAPTRFIPFSIPIETKKRKPASASNHQKNNQNENQLKHIQVDPKSSIKQKKFGQIVVVSPSVKNLKKGSEQAKTKNKENYNDSNRKNGSKNNSRSKSKSKSGIPINFSQSQTFGKPFFNSNSSSFKYGSLKEISPNIQRGNNSYAHSLNNVDAFQKKRFQTSSTGFKDDRNLAKINNYMQEIRPATANKKSVSPTKKSIFKNNINVIKFHY